MATEFLAIGRVLRPHGVHGELLVESLTDFPGHLEAIKVVYLGEAAESHTLAAARIHRHQLILRLEDCHDRESADAYRQQLVQIRTESAAPLPPGLYYHHQLLGLSVYTDDGEDLGQLVDILETGANDVYVVRGAKGEILLPVIESVIRAVDLDQKRLTVHLLEGLR
jgi:16S rRNA processing protein RimM